MLRRLVISALGLIIALVVGSYLIPAKQQVERSRVINQPPEKIWPLIVDPRAWNQWSPWYEKDPQMKIMYEGEATGKGARWSWQSDSQGSGSMQIVDAQEPSKIAYTMAFDGMGVASGQFSLTPKDQGTLVVWSFESDAGANPMARWFGLLVDRFVGPEFEAGLEKMSDIANQ